MMKCPKHPERWPGGELDINRVYEVLDCPNCTEAYIGRIEEEIAAGASPTVPDGFADRVMARLDAAEIPVAPVTLRKYTVRRMTVVHYVAAAAATIVMLLTGSFNLVFQSASEYGTTLTRYINTVTSATAKVPNADSLYRNVEGGLNEFVSAKLNNGKSRDQRRKSDGAPSKK